MKVIVCSVAGEGGASKTGHISALIKSFGWVLVYLHMRMCVCLCMGCVWGLSLSTQQAKTLQSIHGLVGFALARATSSCVRCVFARVRARVCLYATYA